MGQELGHDLVGFSVSVLLHARIKMSVCQLKADQEGRVSVVRYPVGRMYEEPT